MTSAASRAAQQQQVQESRDALFAEIRKMYERHSTVGEATDVYERLLVAEQASYDTGSAVGSVETTRQIRREIAAFAQQLFSAREDDGAVLVRDRVLELPILHLEEGQ